VFLLPVWLQGRGCLGPGRFLVADNGESTRGELHPLPDSPPSAASWASRFFTAVYPCGCSIGWASVGSTTLWRIYRPEPAGRRVTALSLVDARWIVAGLWPKPSCWAGSDGRHASRPLTLPSPIGWWLPLPFPPPFPKPPPSWSFPGQTVLTSSCARSCPLTPFPSRGGGTRLVGRRPSMLRYYPREPDADHLAFYRPTARADGFFTGRDLL